MPCLSTASADATFFLGSTTTPANRAVKGFAVGAGLLIVGFEFEYANTSEDLLRRRPALRTGMGNVLLQTPIAIGGLQPYVTTGGGLYRERLGDRQETQLRRQYRRRREDFAGRAAALRVDYRVFTLRGEPLHSRVHRVYAGANLKF